MLPQELTEKLIAKLILVSVKIQPFYSLDVTNLLRSQRCDLVIKVHSNQYLLLRSKIIMKDAISVICREDHPRLRGDSISIDEFMAEKHVTHLQFDQ